ncbi:hypothetical protein OROHE_010621 [Orobanche hederae]
MVAMGDVFKSFSSVVKEKNVDETCEYEEIEGSMHLIKKTKKEVSVLNESSSVERGNAVMRSKAREQTGPDAETTSEDVNIHIGAARSSRSRAKMIIWRLLRAVQALMIVAALNVPLYV